MFKVYFLWGSILGLINYYIFSCIFSYSSDSTLTHDISNLSYIYLGVLSSCGYSTSRIKAIVNSWGRDFDDNINFFVGNRSAKRDSTTSQCESNQIIQLDTFDDIYPPQNKSLLMLKHMYDHFVDKYQWFIRADDDVYIIKNKLEILLAQFDSFALHYIGKIGYGLPHERNMLGLDGIGFCMGGPTIILSRALLKKIGPFLELCMKSYVSDHEDTEVSRCIYKYGGVKCISDLEIGKYFFHSKIASYQQLSSRLNNYDELLESVTIHPIKNDIGMYYMRNYIINSEIQKLYQNQEDREKELNNLFNLSTALNTNSYCNKSNSIWNFVDDKFTYILSDSKVYIKLSRNYIDSSIIREIKNEIRTKYSMLMFKAISFGFMCSDIDGIHYKFVVHTISNDPAYNNISSCYSKVLFIQLSKYFSNNYILDIYILLVQILNCLLFIYLLFFNFYSLIPS